MQSYSAASGNHNTLSNEQAEFYQKVMLKRLQDNVVFMKYGKKQNIPKNSGAVTSFRRLEMPTMSTTAIVEGTTPDALDLTINKVTATVKQYGAWVKLTDMLNLAGLDPIITETSEMFGDHASLSMDVIVRDVIKASTNKVFPGVKVARSGLAAGDVLTNAVIMKARETMVKNNVPKIKLPNGQQGYLAFVSPETATRIMGMQEWKDQNTYVDVKNREQGIVGQMYGIYFLEASTAPKFTDGGGGTLAGQQTIVIGADAFAIPDIAGSGKPSIMVFTDGSTENPMGLYSTVSWKSAFTSVILEDKRILVIETLDV